MKFKKGHSENLSKTLAIHAAFAGTYSRSLDEHTRRESQITPQIGQYG